MELEEIKQKYPEIAKMTVKDVTKTELFEAVYKEWHSNMLSFINSIPYKYKTFPAEKVFKKYGYAACSDFASEFIKCMDKQSQESSCIREAILVIGNQIYAETVRRLMKKYDEQNSENS